MDLYEALESRRSVRRYEPDVVPAEKIRKVLEAARVAPSWKNMQCWRFIIVRNEETKKLLSVPGCFHNQTKELQFPEQELQF